MNQFNNKRAFSAKEIESNSSGWGVNHHYYPIDPAPAGGDESVLMRAQQRWRGSHGGGRFTGVNSYQTAPSNFSQPRQDMWRSDSTFNNSAGISQPFQQASPQIYPGYPGPGLVDYGGSWNQFSQATPFPAHEATPVFPYAQTETVPLMTEDTNQRIAQPSQEWSRIDTNFLPADIEENSEELGYTSQGPTTVSNCTEISVKQGNADDKGKGRVRKISKLNMRIASGKAPKRGYSGPKGEVRTRQDGGMEFRDVDNPQWTLAAYHKDYRRQFIDDAAKDGEFDYVPTRGEAQDDETSYEPGQQSWGPSRADWHNIVNAEGTKVMFEVYHSKIRRPPQKPGNWVHNGRVLIDSKNHAVKDWPGLNKTLSSEIESWRWEALMRIYPWLTAADLLARMPHEIMKEGKILPLQTQQAFTNRAYRLRVLNQISVCTIRQGSATYRAGILANLAKDNASTTEGLSKLDKNQIKIVKKENKGKFLGHSRYLIDDNDFPKTTPNIKKLERQCESDTESHSQQQVMIPCMGPTQRLKGISRYDDNAYRYSENVDTLHQRMSGEEEWDGLEAENYPESTAGRSNHESLIPLFACIEDRAFAMVMNQSWTTPAAVIKARRDGNPQTQHIGVYWYSSSVPRHVGLDGRVEEDIVDDAAMHLYRAEEPFPGDDELIRHDNAANPFAFGFAQSSNSPAINASLNEPGRESPQGFLSQSSSFPQTTTTSSSSQTPQSASNDMERYQTRSDSFEEVWRYQYGSAGF